MLIQQFKANLQVAGVGRGDFEIQDLAANRHQQMLLKTATAVRDLSYRRVVDSLNTTEERAMKILKDRLVAKWAAGKRTTA
jgi:hypothetical protein